MTIAIEFHAPDSPVTGALTAHDWRSEAFDFWAFDRSVDELHASGQPLHVLADAADVPRLRRELAIRTQRLAARRNAHSTADWFARVLDEHRRVHDLDKPLVRADYDHALDTWQWSLRLDPDAPASLQLAALCHDIERLTSEADVRIEHLFLDYQAFKDAHAAAGARLASALFVRAGVPSVIADDACALIAVHERAGGLPNLRAINDADALSFFSFNCPGYITYFGTTQAARKVAYTYNRMTPEARRFLREIRMPAFAQREISRCAS